MRQKTVTEKYRAVLEGKMAKSEFVRQIRQQYPMHVTQFNGFDDSVQILKNRGLLFEAPTEKKAKVYDERPALPYSDDALQRGIRYELEAAGIAAHDAFNIKLEDFDKAKKKAEDNLMKDPMHYLNLISGESSKVDKHDKEVPVKRGEGKVDVFNGMKKANLREGLSPEQLKKLGARLGIKDPVKLQQIIDKFSSGEKDQAEKDATKKAFGEVMSHPDEIEDGTFPVAEAFKKVGIDMSRDVHIHETDGGTAGLGGGQLKDKGTQSAESVVKMFEGIRKREIAEYEKSRGDREDQYGNRVDDMGDFPIIYEYYYYGDKTPEGKEFKMSFGIFEGTTWDVFQESSNMNEEDDIPFKKVYQADFDELKKFLLNKTKASHDAHVLDGVFHEIFEDAENLVDEQPGTSEIDAIFTVAENLAELYEENGEDEEAAIAEDVLNIIKPIAMASENKVEKAPSGLEEVMVAALRKGYNEEQIVDAVNRIRDRKKGDGPDMDSIAQHTQFYNKEEVETNEGPEDEDDVRYFMIHFGHKFKEDFIVDYINSGNFEAALDQHPLEDEHKDFWEDELAQFDSDREDVREKKVNEDIDSFSDVIQVVGVETVEDAIEVIEKYEREFNDGPVSVDQAKQLVADLRATDEDEHDKNITNLIVKAFNIKLKGVSEKKGKDHDGDGDIDSDDYMAAKDKAIKKAMGKDEQLKEAIKGIIRKTLLSEAATNRLSDVGDKYGDYKGMQVVVNDLENIVTDVESFFAKTRERIQGAFDKIGNIETPDGMKVGAFLAPGIADALFKDLVPVRRLTKKDINLPQTNFIKADPVAEVGIEEEPKQTVFSPVNEKK